MLKTPNRPRAPSAATLRVLYQLAYISSGAAVGVGTLCAEERRRRTQIVQRVADNAKRIRQSPRYAHGAAAVAVREHEVEDNFGWSGNGNEVDIDGLQRFEADGRRARRLENLEGAKMPGLPSVVEEEYGKLVEGKHKKNKRRARTCRPDFVEAHGHRDSATRADLEEQSSRNDRVRSTPTSSHQSSGANKKTSWDWISYQRPLRYGFATEHTLQASSRKTHLFHATAEGRAYQDPYNTYEQVATFFLTRDMWTGHDGVKMDLSPETLARDVDVFFEIVNASTSLKTNKQHACKIADELLHLSLDLGTVKATRSLLLWKLAVEALSVEDLFDVAKSFAPIAESLAPEATMQFFSDLFATSVYSSATKVDKLRINMRLRAEALNLDTNEDHLGLYDELIDSIAIPPKLSNSAVSGLLEQECRNLMDSGHLPSAIKLWCMTMRTRRYDRETDLQLDADLFDAALTDRHLSLCVRMLRFKDSRDFRNHSHQKDAFIKVCFEAGGTGLLRSLFGRKRTGALRHNDNLSPESYAYLSRCFADTKKSFEMFKMYYDRVPLELRASVAEASVSDTSFALKAQWKATRNLDQVRASYEQALERAERNGPTEEARRPLHVTMIEVELSANQTVSAIGALTQLNKSGSDGSVATLTALALAKQQEWGTFGRLFEALQRDGRVLGWTPPATRAFNNVLHLFSRSHSAQQLSDFATMAFGELGFRPNKATWEVLLSSLVSKRAVSLLEYWINFSDASGSKVTLDAHIGAALMKRWYLDFRQSHVMVMWFCRNLVQRASSLRSDALLSVVREAIGFDLRTLHGVNAPWMGPIIRARRALVDSSGGYFPKPGYIWNGQLYDKARSTNGRKALPLPLTSSRGTVAEESALLPADSTAEDATSEASMKTWVLYSQRRPTDGAKTSEVNEESSIFGAGALVNTLPTVDKVTAPESDVTDVVPGYTSAINDFSLKDVRLSYASTEAAVVTSKIEGLQRQIISYFSLHQYESVLELYNASLDATDLPASPLLLEVAVEASLRIRSNRQEAEQIMSAARDAGMNVTCAMGPLIIDQIHRTSLNDRYGVAALRDQVMEYYRQNDLNGLHVKHHVGTAAAHTLIQAGFAESGVNLLSTILQSSWCAEEPLDITAMSVWLSGYAALGHVKGMHWVVEEVLDQGMSIDQGFLRALKRARRPAIRLNGDGPLSYRKQEPKTLAYLKQWYNLCSRKRSTQMQESKVFGRKLVNLLATAASDGHAMSQVRPGRKPRFLSSHNGKTGVAELDSFEQFS